MAKLDAERQGGDLKGYRTGPLHRASRPYHFAETRDEPVVMQITASRPRPRHTSIQGRSAANRPSSVEGHENRIPESLLVS